jgi:hypothetical protein
MVVLCGSLIKKETGERRRREKTARLASIPAVEGQRTSLGRWSLSVIARGTGVYFKGARLFEEIVVGLCTTDLNGFRLQDII